MTTKTKIEWCDYTINPVKGLCPVGCSYCYARRLYDRFGWNPKIRWWPPAFDLLDTLKKPSRIFVGSTMELFHPSLPENWMEYNQRTAMKYPQHTFIFLTKLPENLPREWPDNCWVGVSVTGDEAMKDACEGLDCTCAQVKFLSFEPLLGPLSKANLELISAGYHYRWLDWVIIGQCTPIRKSTMPKLEQITEIVQAADKAGVSVFLKDNLFALLDCDSPVANCAFDKEGGYRQEFPNTTEEAR